MTAPIVIDHLTKHFASVKAVVDVTLEVAAAEIVGFLGPNGAGKTTTMRLLLGFINPTSGRCAVVDMSLQKRLQLKTAGRLPAR